MLKALKTLSSKRSGKFHREHQVLLGLVDYYIKTGQPVGSNTLKETEFEDLSSATIRNYFAHLERKELLKQQHISGGRIPTDLAFKAYADEYYNDPNPLENIGFINNQESHEIASYLQRACEELSNSTQTAVFLSSPRFDHDFILNIKLLDLDQKRCLAVLMTDFGLVQTEVLHIEHKLSSFSTKRLESYFHWRLNGLDQPENLSPEEEALAHKFYNELMVRYIVGYSQFHEEEILRTGFSQLLNYPELRDATNLAKSLALFENAHMMRLILRETQKYDSLKYWIGRDLMHFSSPSLDSTIISIPYYINQKSVGAIGIIGPTRIPYRKLFPTLREFSKTISASLTNMVHKFKISFREPQADSFYLEKEEQKLIGQSRHMLIENKTEKIRRKIDG